MEIGNIIPHIEALIFASEKALTPIEITDIINNAFGFMEDKIVLDQVEAALEGIVEKYNSEFYPFEVRQSGGGWQFLTKKDYHKTIAQLNGDKFLKRLSSAALETLAIIAYKQPITKSEIEAIRGVNCDYAVQRLLEKDLVIITGRNESLPGKPLIYSTSKSFMDYFGINTADDLPKIREILAEQAVEPTYLTGAGAEGVAEEEEVIVTETTLESETLLVGPDGELISAAELNQQEEETGQVEETPEAAGDEQSFHDVDQEEQPGSGDQEESSDDDENTDQPEEQQPE
ncbi:MAG: SMC-Scp complex subunit ScpB [Bacteroidota bacterium]|nr:SMC-Scp complex subunit ScpB [Bacteroidota bacterium]